VVVKTCPSVLTKTYQGWVSKLDSSLKLQGDPSHPFHKDPYKLRSIEVQAYDKFWKSETHYNVGFFKLNAEVSNSEGKPLPGIVFLRGPAVAMLVMLIPDDAPKGSDERYVVMTVQPRIPAGSLEFVEIPAGMVDDKTKTFAGTAANEIKEELHLTIKEDSLVNMSELVEMPDRGKESLPLAMYPSVGGCDEYISIFMHEEVVSRDTLEKWNGKYTGLRDEGEKITLKIIKMQDLWKVGCRDAKALSALALWENLRREGKIKSVLDPE